MMNGKQLDESKFHRNIYFKGIQEMVKGEVDDMEDREIEKLFQMTKSFVPRRDLEKQKKQDFKFFSDKEKFSMIMRAVSEQSGEPIEKIKKHRHFRDIVTPRNIVIFLTRFTTDLSLNEIGRAVVNGVKLNHSTVSHACQRMKEAIDTKEHKTYNLILQVVAQLQDEGFYIDFRFQQPEWFKRMINKQEKNENVLVIG